MMTIFGNRAARAGRIDFNGQDITAVPTHQVARLRIAQSPKDGGSFAHERRGPADGRGRRRQQ